MQCVKVWMPMSVWFFGVLALGFLLLLVRYYFLAKHYRQIRSLHNIRDSFNASLDLSVWSSALGERLLKELKLSQVALWVWHPSEQRLILEGGRSSRGLSLGLGAASMLGEGFSGQVALEQKSRYLSDLKKEAKSAVEQGGIPSSGSLFLLPLVRGGKLLGVLSVAHPRTNGLDEEERGLVELVAQQVAMALENTLLYTEMRQLSRLDELTQVYNRRHFQEILEMEFRRARRFERPLSLLMLDADHFKSINDRLGHLQGDQILTALARLLSSHLREVDTLARYGGEEFAAILPNTKAKDAEEVAQKLAMLSADSSPSWFGQKGERLTLSVGVAELQATMDSVDDLINEADLALYEAKETGRNRVVVFSDKSSRRLALVD